MARARRAAVRPVQPDPIAHRAAEQLVDRHAERLGLDVPQRQLDAGDRLVRTAAEVLPRARSMSQYSRSHRPRILADQQRLAGRAPQPATPCGLRLSLHSPQPTSPSSVSTLTNVHGRQPASQWNG